MGNLRELALGRPYRRTRKLLAQTEFLSADRLAQTRDALLAKTLALARQVPFYRDHLNRPDVRGQAPLAQLMGVPVIDKQTVRKHAHAFRRGAGLRALKATTGGSTGQPLVFYMDRFKTRQMEKAFIFDQWRRVGYRMGDPIFNLRGRTPQNGRFTHHDRLFNIYYASSFGLTPDRVAQYVDAVDRIRPRYLHGYPSTMYQLAVLMQHAGLRFKTAPRAVFCGSEKLFAYQRKLIEDIFACRAYAWYGHSECLALGGACEESNRLHFYPQYGYVETLPTGVRNGQGKQICEIVATGFNNPVMPLLRYRTGDYAVVADRQTCGCGRNYLLIEEVLGREQEFIVDRRGDLVSATSLVFGQHFEVFAGLDGLFLRQQTPGEIEIVMKSNSAFKQSHFEAMQSRISDLLAKRFNVGYRFTDDMPRSPIGKARLVQQALDIKPYLQARDVQTCSNSPRS